MYKDNKKIIRILYILGIIPVIWFSLLIAPYLKYGIVEIVNNLNNILENSFSIVICENSLRAVLIFLLIYILVILIYETTRKNYRRNEEHGSAKWGKAVSLNKKYKQKDNYNKIFTRNVSIGIDGKKHRRNVNVLVVGR